MRFTKLSSNAFRETTPLVQVNKVVQPTIKKALI